jgi:hypothetical protein
MQVDERRDYLFGLRSASVPSFGSRQAKVSSPAGYFDLVDS